MHEPSGAPAPGRTSASTENCCSLSGPPLDPAESMRAAALLKALSDPTRLRLLSLIAAQGCDDVCACDLVDVLDVGQPTISHHLKKLVEAGFLTREQRGKWAYYTVVREPFAELQTLLALG